MITGAMLQQLGIGVFLAFAAMFFTATAVAMFRFVTVYGRLHAAGKCLTGGAISVIMAAMIHSASLPVIARLLVAGILLLMTSTMGTHALTRAAHQNGVDLQRLEDDAYGRAVAKGLHVGEQRSGRPPGSSEAH